MMRQEQKYREEIDENVWVNLFSSLFKTRRDQRHVPSYSEPYRTASPRVESNYHAPAMKTNKETKKETKQEVKKEVKKETKQEIKIETKKEAPKLRQTTTVTQSNAQSRVKQVTQHHQSPSYKEPVAKTYQPTVPNQQQQASQLKSKYAEIKKIIRHSETVTEMIASYVIYPFLFWISFFGIFGKYKLTLVKIRFWEAENENIGHVSLYVPDNFLYVSFWPDEHVSGSNAVKKVKGTNNSYVEDVDAEGKKEDETLEGSIFMDLSGMEQCWEKIRTKSKYSLALYNCADAVMEVLAAGNCRFQVAYDATPPTIADPKTLAKTLDMWNYAVVLVLLAIESLFFHRVALRIKAFRTCGLFSAVSHYFKRFKGYKNYVCKLFNADSGAKCSLTKKVIEGKTYQCCGLHNNRRHFLGNLYDRGVKWSYVNQYDPREEWPTRDEISTNEWSTFFYHNFKSFLCIFLLIFVYYLFFW